MMNIDFHAHILPGMDHGCMDLKTSILQIRTAQIAGVDFIVASSHFYPHIDTVDDFIARRAKAWDTLSCSLAPESPTVLLGAEIFVCEGMEKMNGLMRLSVGSSSVLLLEMPYKSWSQRIRQTVLCINEQCDRNAVLAHVDRYEARDIDALFEQGLMGQVNISSLYKRRIRGNLLHWINDHKIAALGSDIHGKSGVYKKFAKARSVLGEGYSQVMKTSECLLMKNT
jgi:protein-tyrosine phosphatase